MTDRDERTAATRAQVYNGLTEAWSSVSEITGRVPVSRDTVARVLAAARKDEAHAASLHLFARQRRPGSPWKYRRDTPELLARWEYADRLAAWLNDWLELSGPAALSGGDVVVPAVGPPYALLSLSALAAARGLPLPAAPTVGPGPTDELIA